MDQLCRFEASLLPHVSEDERAEMFLRYRKTFDLTKVKASDIEDSWNLLRHRKVNDL